ncbi:peptidoglycan-associated lipoprotein [Flavobacteriaceae bacterium UJ101]|nr:peptidoglycan-associated lipoprotein [Flavobacteriaceae bacterium UJ101]
MKKTISSLLALGFLFSATAQEKIEQYYGSEQEYENYVKFKKDQRKFNSWSVSLHGGSSMMAKGELTSLGLFGGEDFNIGYDVQLGLTKHINHAFGIQLLGQLGQTTQSVLLGGTKYATQSDYQAVSLIGDINLSSIFRRVDNKSRYAWALHGYGGVGIIGYETKADGNTNAAITDGTTLADVDMDFESMFAQVGWGLQYKLNQSFDLEFKSMYVMTGDEEYDGSTGLGLTGPGSTGGDNDGSDNFWTNSLGIIYKIGKHNEHEKWYDPFQALYSQQVLDKGGFECIDEDNDGVCDEWDCELGTLAGARVDGCGKALDVDLDGFIDLEDKCVTVPGVENGTLGRGCPIEKEEVKPVDPVVITTDVINLSDVEFYYNEARWYPEYNNLLKKAARAIKANPDANFKLEGHTDARGSDAYNQKLSQRRADAIRKYLISQGADASRISAIGKGESEILNHCVNGVKCSNDEHRVNRRVLLRADRKLVMPN